MGARFRSISISAVAALVFVATAAANPLRDQVRAYRVAHEKEILGDLVRLMAMPNVATSVADVDKNASFLAGELERRGLRTQLLRAAPDTPAAVYGELTTPGARRTVLFYAHYDGQPVAQSGWRSDPWQPVVRAGHSAADSRDVDWRAAPRLDPEWRVYGRSASDDKVSVQALLVALDALRAAKRAPTVNVKVFFEGEEEQGSHHLPEILRANRALLAGDLFVLSDGPRHQSGAMQVVLGARGVTGVELTVYGPARPLHDGHYGNWAPNPAVMLVHLLASLRDDDGRILVPGFYDDVRSLSAAEKQAIDALPDVETALRRELALGRTETSERLAAAISRPALNVRGIRVGDVGDAGSNTIFTEARASIDFRLVPDQTPERVRDRVERFLADSGWTVVHDEPSAEVRAAHPRVVRTEWSLDYAAYRTDLSSPPVRAVIASVKESVDGPVVVLPMLGGSLPLAMFASGLQMPLVVVPFANYDNNQHAANENLRLQNFWDAIEIDAGLLTTLEW